jgi:ubiquinone/menaquinone biosynthesis C-methylase UbiE
MKHPSQPVLKILAENLPFENNLFDAVVLSFVLCSVNAIEKAVDEINRVLKPGGTIILLEHIGSDNKIIKIIQNIYSETYSKVANNCHPNRNPLPIINNIFSGLSIKAKIPYVFSNLVFAKAYK